eukprot:2474774-Pyramimonas_sp.AAC.1
MTPNPSLQHDTELEVPRPEDDQQGERLQQGKSRRGRSCYWASGPACRPLARTASQQARRGQGAPAPRPPYAGRYHQHRLVRPLETSHRSPDNGRPPGPRKRRF